MFAHECKPLDYWKQNSERFHGLSVLARKYLALPATSAPVECLFSVAGKTFRSDKCDPTFEKLMMMKCNAKLDRLFLCIVLIMTL